MKKMRMVRKVRNDKSFANSLWLEKDKNGRNTREGREDIRDGRHSIDFLGYLNLNKRLRRKNGQKNCSAAVQREG